MRQERSESARERRIVSNLLFYAISHYGLYQGESGDYSDVSRFGLAVRLVSGRTSVRYRFGSPFSSKRLWFVDTVLWLCPSLPSETLKWLSSLPILMQKSFWWWQCSDRYLISLSPPPPFSPSLISRTVSVDVKHHFYLLSLAIYIYR